MKCCNKICKFRTVEDDCVGPPVSEGKHCGFHVPLTAETDDGAENVSPLILAEQEMVYRRVVYFEKDHVVISDQEWRENWIDEYGNEGDMWVEDFMVRIPKREISQISKHEDF